MIETKYLNKSVPNSSLYFISETPTAKADGVLRYYTDFFNTLTVSSTATTH